METRNSGNQGAGYQQFVAITCLADFRKAHPQAALEAAAGGGAARDGGMPASAGTSLPPRRRGIARFWRTSTFRAGPAKPPVIVTPAN